MKIFVRTPSGRMICLRVYRDETLYDVKKKIIEKHNFVFDGVVMNDDYCTMADYNIKHQSTLDLQEKMQIYLKEPLNGFTCTVDVNSSDTIDDIKNKIEDDHGFPKGRQCLIFGDETLEGERTLADYNICKDSTLHLILYPCRGIKMQIYVKMLTGKTATFSTDSSHTVNNIKVKIYEMESLPPVHQRLFFSGMQLKGSHTLASYNIKDGCTLHLALRLCGS